MRKTKRIVVTGGHSTPAIAVIEELQLRGGWEVFYFGRKYAFEGKKVLSDEQQIIPEFRVKFFSITTGRLQRRFTRYTIPSLLKIPFGFLQAFFYLLKIRPKIILSFGSYVSTPTVVAGWLLGIPVVSHEQTIGLGLATKINSLFSKIVAVSYEETRKNFPPTKSVVFTGNPLRKSVFKQSGSAFAREVGLRCRKTKKPLIYITGGRLGSRIVNQAIKEIVPWLIKNFVVVHQTGVLDFQRLFSFSEDLPVFRSQNYFIKRP